MLNSLIKLITVALPLIRGAFFIFSLPGKTAILTIALHRNLVTSSHRFNSDKNLMLYLCASNTIIEGQSKGFTLNDVELFAVRKQQKLVIYRNQCPHLGIQLEWLPDQFLDSDGCLIQCAMHGALFLIESGDCISGPCQGQKLTAVAHTERDGSVFVTL